MMSDQDIHALEGMLKQRREELDLIRELDQIRDTTPEPSAMLASIVNLLGDRFHADLCLLAVIDRDTGDLELKAVHDRGRLLHLLGADAVQALAGRAFKADGIAIWGTDEALAELDVEQMPENLQLAAVPIIMGPNLRLGAVLLARLDSSFAQSDVDLLAAAESQLDSAVIQGYAYYELQQRNKELEAIYRVDRIRDEHLPFDEMLNMVLQELRGALQAEMGFILLYDRAGKRLDLRAVSHDDLFRLPSYHEVVERVSNEALHEARLVTHNDLDGDLRSVMCIPLILRDEILGVFGVANGKGAWGFEEQDQRLLSAIASQMDTAIFESLEQRRLRQVLGRSVDPRVMERLLANSDVGFLKGERMVLSVLYADIRDSTALAERTEPELLVGFINDYLGRMSEVILSHEGTLDKFIGDEVMALFGAPVPQPDHALRAVRVGLAMQAAHQAVVEEWRGRGVDAMPIGVGIATGELTVGEMGSVHRTDYTVIGRTANLGARICTAAKPGQVLISQETYDMIADQIEAAPIAGLEMKGIDKGVTVYHVTRLVE